MVINATGPFTDGLRQMDDSQNELIVAPSSGIHITLPDVFGSSKMGMLDPSTSDGRVIFLLPWQGKIIAGTTDAPADLESDPVASEEAISWVLREVNKYMKDEVQLSRDDVLSAWSGLRPLVRDPSAPNTQEVVRNHMINISSSGLITIAGGKWTTYRVSQSRIVPMRRGLC